MGTTQKHSASFDVSEAVSAAKKLTDAFRSQSKAISAITKATRSYNKAFSNMNKGQAGITSVLNKNNVALNKGVATLNKVDKVTKRVAKSTKVATKQTTLLGSKLGLVGKLLQAQIIQSIFSSITSIIKGTVGEMIKLNIKISEFQTISLSTFGKLGNDLKGVRDEIRGISGAFALDQADVIEAQYQAISNQVKGAAENFNFLESAARLAIVAVSSIADAGNLMSSVINSMNLSFTRADQVAQALFKTVQLGRVRIPEMANDFGRSAALANQLGVELEELLSLFATITVQGVKFANAQTFITNVFLRLIKPTERMIELFDEWGFASTKVALATDGLIGLVARLNKEIQSGTDSLSELGEEWGSIRAIIGAAIIGDNIELGLENLKKIKEASADFNTALELRLNNTGQVVKAEFTRIGNSFSENIGNPIIGQIAAWSFHTNAWGTELLKIVGLRSRKKLTKLVDLFKETNDVLIEQVDIVKKLGKQTLKKLLDPLISKLAAVNKALIRNKKQFKLLSKGIDRFAKNAEIKFRKINTAFTTFGKEMDNNSRMTTRWTDKFNSDLDDVISNLRTIKNEIGDVARSLAKAFDQRLLESQTLGDQAGILRGRGASQQAAGGEAFRAGDVQGAREALKGQIDTITQLRRVITEAFGAGIISADEANDSFRGFMKTERMVIEDMFELEAITKKLQLAAGKEAVAGLTANLSRGLQGVGAILTDTSGIPEGARQKLIAQFSAEGNAISEQIRLLGESNLGPEEIKKISDKIVFQLDDFKARIDTATSRLKDSFSEMASATKDRVGQFKDILSEFNEVINAEQQGGTVGKIRGQIAGAQAARGLQDLFGKDSPELKAALSQVLTDVITDLTLEKSSLTKALPGTFGEDRQRATDELVGLATQIGTVKDLFDNLQAGVIGIPQIFAGLAEERVSLKGEQSLLAEQQDKLLRVNEKMSLTLEGILENTGTFQNDIQGTLEAIQGITLGDLGGIGSLAGIRSRLLGGDFSLKGGADARVKRLKLEETLENLRIQKESFAKKAGLGILEKQDFADLFKALGPLPAKFDFLKAGVDNLLATFIANKNLQSQLNRTVESANVEYRDATGKLVNILNGTASQIAAVAAPAIADAVAPEQMLGGVSNLAGGALQTFTDFLGGDIIPTTEANSSSLLTNSIATDIQTEKIKGSITAVNNNTLAMNRFANGIQTLKIGGLARGGSTDTIPAMLSPGEFVMRASSAKALGPGALNHMNKFGKVPGKTTGSGRIQGFAEGGTVTNTNNNTFNFASSGNERVDARRMVTMINREQSRGTASLTKRRRPF